MGAQQVPGLLSGGSNRAPSARLAGEPGEGQGVTQLFRDRHAELVRLAVLLVGDRATAEDVVQDVFTRIYARDRLPEGSTALVYVRAAVINGCRSALRSRGAAHRSRVRQQAQTVLQTQDSAEHEVILADECRNVLAALAALPARRREVLVPRYWLGLSEAEIAAALGISRGTVKSTAARGLAALAKSLGETS